jgi:hypothetical protein
MPTFYDIISDTRREATQADIDGMQDAAQAFGQLVAFLRAGPREMAVGLGVEIAVKRAQGSIASGVSAEAFRKLLEMFR